ncbi:hypothetical protein DFQ28_007112 [Apophysomyces sp. BC1034]|nr:hypothetical protein DFQ28_007112 [Apophysomyces sp. BC1034]
MDTSEDGIAEEDSGAHTTQQVDRAWVNSSSTTLWWCGNEDRNVENIACEYPDDPMLVDDCIDEAPKAVSKEFEDLVEWLTAIHHHYQLLPKTLAITVKKIEHYLSEHAVSQNWLQFVGVYILFSTASFEEEATSPSLGQLIAMTNHSCTKEYISKQELWIFAEREFRRIPTTVAGIGIVLVGSENPEEGQMDK